MVDRKVWAYVGLLLTVLIIGTAPILIKVGLKYASVTEQLAHRFGIAAIALVLFYLLRDKRLPRYRRADHPSLLLLSLFYPLSFFSLQAIGLQYTTASESGIISATTPLFTLVLAQLFLKEKNSPIQIISMLLSVLGVAYTMYKNGLEVSGETLKGDCFILFSALSMSLYFFLARKNNAKCAPMEITFYIVLVGAIVFNLFALGEALFNGDPSGYWRALGHGEYLLTVLLLGLLSTALSSFFNNNALQQLSASKVSVFNNLSPIVSLFGGVLLLGETLRGYHIVGTILVILGVVGMNRCQGKRVRK